MNKDLELEMKDKVLRNASLSLEASVKFTDQIYNICLTSLRRIAMQTNTLESEEMYCVQRAEYEAYYNVFSKFFEDPCDKELIDEVIRYEEE